MYDAAIIGTGPAGLSAALTLKLHNKDILWFGPKAMSDKVGKSEKIANYPGNPMITGKALNKVFEEQAADMEIEITDKRVTNIADLGTHFMILAENDMYEARAELFATGVAAAKGMPGEAELLGKGVSYCATCDGFLYKGKDIAVYCTDKRMEHDIRYLEEIAGRLYIYTSFGYATDAENAEVLAKPIKRIAGDSRVNGAETADGRMLDVQGVFVLRSAIAPDTVMPGLETDGPHIVVNRKQETNYKGCYAAGDCTGRPYQIAKAAGEGNVAAHSILDYLSNS